MALHLKCIDRFYIIKEILQQILSHYSLQYFLLVAHLNILSSSYERLICHIQ